MPIYLVIYLDIMHLSIVTKFHEDLIKAVCLIEGKHLAVRPTTGVYKTWAYKKQTNLVFPTLVELFK